MTTLMKSADIALYAAKSSGRNTYRIFLPEMLESHNNVAILERRLKLALEKKEFIIEYQPIVSMSNYDIVALEALIRWPISEDGKTVTPDIFIPIAEQTNLINDISMFVIEQVMVQMVEWAKKGVAWNMWFPSTCLRINCGKVFLWWGCIIL